MKAQWKLTLEAAKAEALLAADLYNQAKRPRRLEGFLVHMHIAWLYLLLATRQRNHEPYHYRLPNGRYDRVDGEPKTWDLAKLSRERWGQHDPVRRNLELTIALRNRVEHRYADALAIATAGYAQALLLNFESELTAVFGAAYSLGEDLRFPIFIGQLSREGAARLAAAQQRLPSKTKLFLTQFESDLSPTVRDDPRYEFRVHLVRRMGPKTDADLAVTFVRADELSEDERRAIYDANKRGTVIVREHYRDVVNVDKLKPGQAASQIEAQIPFRFSLYSHFQRARAAHKVRPERGDPHPERTRTEFCVYDTPNDSYLYTSAFVAKVVSECATADGFRQLLGMDPEPKPADPAVQIDDIAATGFTD